MSLQLVQRSVRRMAVEAAVKKEDNGLDVA